MDNQVTPDERAELVKMLKLWGVTTTHVAADLIEADGKLLALAEKTIASVKEWREHEYHEMHASGVGEFCTGCEMTNDLGARLAEYDAAKEDL